MRGSTITGMGRYVPRRVMTNHELEKIVETTDEWIVSRTGIRERRIAAPEEASSDLAFHAAQEALADAGVSPEQIDLIIVGTATPDMLFPATACIVQDRLGARNAGAFDVSADGECMEKNDRKMYKSAARGMPKATAAGMLQARVAAGDVDGFIVPQACIRMIYAAAERLGQPREKFFINVERYGNTSSASVPVALYEAVRTGRLKEGDLAVLVAFGGGLTWGSCAVRWTMPTTRDPGSRA